jgi:hypothetical protein
VFRDQGQQLEALDVLQCGDPGVLQAVPDFEVRRKQMWINVDTLFFQKVNVFVQAVVLVSVLALKILLS